MFKSPYSIFLLFLALIFLSACVGQPKVPENRSHKKSSVLWAENTNIDADEDDSVDISDLDKNVVSSEDGGAYQTMQRIPFPLSEYNALARSGKGTIQGQIYLQDDYGTKIYGAKTRLYLNPVTSYSRQWYEQSYLNGHKMGQADSRLFNYLKFTASDDSGSFAFYGVPSGRYYLIGTVTCSTECGYANKKSIRIAKEIFIQGNQVLDQDLSRGI